MCSVARHSEHKGISCGRIQCALEEGLFSLIVHIQANGVFWPLPSFWNVFSLSLPVLKLVPFSSPPPLLLFSTETSGSICPLNMVAAEHDHLPLNTAASSSHL